MIKVSESFNLRDFFVSESYPQIAQSMDFPMRYEANISRLATALEDVKDIIGEFKINSGFRSKLLNKAVKGAKSSDHLYAAAVDITNEYIQRNIEKVIHEIIDSGIYYRQLIGYEQGFIHLSVQNDFKLVKHQVLWKDSSGFRGFV